MCAYLSSDRFENSRLEVDIRFFAAGCCFLLIVGYFSSWGRWVEQPYDCYKHNAILHDLVSCPWPVYYINGSEKSMLTYYIGQYLVPALIGKTLSSLRAAEIAVYFWNMTGLFIIWMNMMVFLKHNRIRDHVLELFMLIFFSVPQSIVEILVWLFYGVDCLYKNNIRLLDGESVLVQLQYTGNCVSLRWIYNQLIAVWIMILIFLQNKKDIRRYVLYFIPCVLYAPLPFIGLLPIVIGNAACKFFTEKINTLKMIFSIENILCTVGLGSVLVAYYYGNVFEPKPERLGFRVQEYGDRFGIYIIFVACNVLLYAVFLFRDHYGDCLYYTVFGELLVLPLFSMGLYNDLVMRVSIPALFVVMLWMTKLLADRISMIKKNNTMKHIVVTIVMIGIVINASLYQINRFADRIVEEDFSKVADWYSYGSMQHFANREFAKLDNEERERIAKEYDDMTYENNNFDEDLVYNYFSYDIDDNLFYKYIARTKITDKLDKM